MGIEYISWVMMIGIFSIISWKLSLLHISGSIAAFFVGCFITFGFGLKGIIVIAVFFISSSILSKYKKKQKKDFQDGHEKGSTRDWVQVCANGGIAAVCGLLAFFNEPLFIYAFAISLACANADTWASEIGTLSKRAPVSIKGFKSVSAGTSGAVSVLGTVAGLLGASVIAGTVTYLFHLSPQAFLFITLFGFLGMFIDTLLGAFFQAEFQCSNCGQLIEKTDHCGKKARLMKGVYWMRNDAVNLLSNLLVVIAGVIYF